MLGYIKNRGQNSNLTGWWQVYGDEAEAARLFSRFRKCREDVYKRQSQYCVTVCRTTDGAILFEFDCGKDLNLACLLYTSRCV